MRLPAAVLAVALLAVALLALAVLAARGPDRGPVSLVDYTVTGPRTLQVFVASCHGDPEVTSLQETTRQVRVEVTADRPGAESEACSDGLTITLESPLGDRSIVDENAFVPVPREG